ncbi:type III toxin-antitoxin system ToxN/AbiQ family toxin [Tissierella sp. Yu-01]|uniref:type III toxin-antitoxin system ToxN/AbiQ family toxin n=1 Tax=Tissierella sp. Yu-01 TaxID=3035694 RepID=UPI00240E478F|nr:type III toxin-antitoxin system ToxN/AbiQ family toxin [Tissierella sp. Yu-01]WFA07920.1 type III toxin-antitoxin system ToxN/AbiQ family toxin [Tissierella sp. Yu-01]
MDKLSFYDVDKEYINYLKQEEIKRRGFTKVPNIEYKNEQKFLCGIVLSINNVDYYVPVTSYKKKKSENFLIIFDDDKFNKIKGSLRFNFMIPVPKVAITERIINDEENGIRRIFLQKQLDYINSNRQIILNRSKRTYLRIINNYNPELTKNSCDFKFLEEKCLEYQTVLEAT